MATEMIKSVPMDISAILRPEVKDFAPYLPGKPLAEVRRELGLRKIVKLASNENALGASPKAMKAVRASRDIHRYPEGPGTPLRRELAGKLGVRFEETILGAGSDELIEILAKTFFNRGDEIVVSEHAFIRYKMAGDLLGIRTVSVPMRGFTHDLPAMAGRVGPRTKAVFIANPNNPTGTYVSRNEVDRFFEIISRRAGDLGWTGGRQGPAAPLIVFDEAYYEFARELAPDYPETLEIFKKGFNVVVLRTFSKVHGLAGLRIGYGVARSDVAAAMDRVRPPFNVSSVAQDAALAALSDPVHVRRSASLVKRELAKVAGGLEKIGLRAVPSAGNFLLVDAAPRTGADLFRKLLAKGVIVRALDEYGYPNCVRVTIGRPDENRFLLKKLKEIL